MSELNVTIETVKTAEEIKTEKLTPVGRAAWETPKLEDVSEQVMAQPYIRFT
jgi:prefoldin subunit 5